MDVVNDLHHLVDARTEIDLTAGAELAQMTDDPLEDVREWEVRHHPVVGVAPKALERRGCRPGQVAMRQDRGLGHAGGTRGIDQAGGVIRLQGLPAARQQPGARAAEFIATSQGLLPTDHPLLHTRVVALDQDDPP